MSINEVPRAPKLCLLYGSPEYSRITNQQGLENYRAGAFANSPALAIGVGSEGISLVDPNTNAVLASVEPGRFTATPETYSPTDPSAESASTTLYTQPQVLVDIADQRRLRIAILPMRYSGWNGLQFRYAWRAEARARNGNIAGLGPTHVTTDAEWFSLLEVFGVASLAVDEAASGMLDRRARSSKIYVIAVLTLLFVISIVFFAWYFWAMSTGAAHHR